MRLQRSRDAQAGAIPRTREGASGNGVLRVAEVLRGHPHIAAVEPVHRLRTQAPAACEWSLGALQKASGCQAAQQRGQRTHTWAEGWSTTPLAHMHASVLDDERGGDAYGRAQDVAAALKRWYIGHAELRREMGWTVDRHCRTFLPWTTGTSVAHLGWPHTP